MGKKILSHEQDIEVCKLYIVNKLSSTQIAIRYDVSRASILRTLRRERIVRRKKTSVMCHLAWNRIDEVIADYCGNQLTVADIKRKYNCSLPTIWHIANSKNIPRRLHQITSDAGREVCRLNGRKRNIYPINNTFFDNIDNEEKAYWWGFLYADGYVGKNAKALVVNLGNSDRNHLEKFRNLISPTRPVRLEIKYRKQLGKITYTSVLRVDDNHLCKRLQELGMIPKRPYWERVKDNLPNDLFPHWLRGYFDGDGTASKNNPTIRILGQENLLCWIVDKLNLYNILHTTAIPYQKSGKNGTKINIYEVVFGGSRQMVSLREYLYNNATIYLERKKIIIDTYKIKR